MELNVNRKHKDSVFSALFGTPEVLRELYSAIEGIDIPPDAVVDINTLSDALFMKHINDLSFTINNRIVVLIEHQSTINENVPLRLLMYIARIYEKIIDKKRFYHRGLEKIPTPEFIVLYNGKHPYPDYKELRLSAAFKNISDIKQVKNTEIPLELIVQVFNINHGHNSEILKRCETLENYSIFIGKINEYNEKLTLEESVKDAVKYCIEHDILKEFLKKHSSEVINMLYEDLTFEEIIDIRVQEELDIAREKSREEAWVESKETIARNLLAEGMTLEFVQKTTGLPLEEIEKLGCS